MADLLFDWFEFDQKQVNLLFIQHSKAAESKQIEQEVSRTVIIPPKLFANLGTMLAQVSGSNLVNVERLTCQDTKNIQ